MDLLDLAEVMPDEEPPNDGLRLVPRYPTLSCEPQVAQRVWRALEERDWRALKALHVVWYDQYAERWFPIGPHFWDHMEYVEILPLFPREA